MSSFIGHGLAALTIGKGFSEKTRFRNKKVWQIFLVFCAFAPDIDYLISGLNAPNNGGVRLSHTIIFSLILPLLGTVYLFLFERKNVFWGGVQASLAGLSHLLLDLLVGGRYPDPLFFPFSLEIIDLPLGILPSAGKLSVSNYYFYRNLLMECGILIPIFLLILQLAEKLNLSKISLILSVISFLIFLSWSINLTR